MKQVPSQSRQATVSFVALSQYLSLHSQALAPPVTEALVSMHSVHSDAKGPMQYNQEPCHESHKPDAVTI